MDGQGTVRLPGTGVLVSRSGPGRSFMALPSLQRMRWLLPLDGLPRRTSLERLLPSTLKGIALRLLINTGLLRGEQVRLHSVAMEALMGEVAQILGEPEVSVAISCGTEGAYRKHTIQVMNLAGSVLAYVKVPASPLAGDTIRAEERNVRLLGEVAELRGQVPVLLGCCRWENGDGLILSPGPVSPGPTNLGREHFIFLQRLHGATATRLPFAESTMWRRMEEDVAQLGPQLPPPWVDRYAAALSVLATRLWDLPMPLATVHRDFAPWNTRLGEGGLFVFDWESAQEGSTPLYDAFHFNAIRAALAGKPYRPGPFCQGLLQGCWPEGQPHLPWLYLAYLVDMSLFYAKARVRAPELGDERVLNWFGSQIDIYLGGRS